VNKIRKRIIVCAVLGVAMLAMLLVPRRTVFYTSFLCRKVSLINKKLTRDIYKGHSDNVYKILVAEDSRSIQCIRFVFFSKYRLGDEEQQGILDEIFVSMQENTRFPNQCEVFFFEKKQAYKAYVSEYIQKNPEDWYEGWYYTDWYSVPNIEETLSFSSLKKMLKEDINQSMYVQKYLYPIEDRTPEIPV